MKNYEKYGRELKKYRGGMFCDDYVKPDVLKLKKDDECDHDCVRCLIFQMLWLLEDCEESEVDWNKIKVDTPLLVRNYINGEWSKRYFAKYEDGKVYTWINGRTSWNETGIYAWKYAKLAEPEVDWSKVEVDTPILVRDIEYNRWIKRYFAKYENGLIYAWNGGATSWSTDAITDWAYAKLAEMEDTE